MVSNYPKGSEWRKWDLHIHTPCSIIQDYGGDQKTIWDRFIESLATLPKEITAIAVTDYLFLEGYKKLLERRNEFLNIKLLIPNIEFRLDIFSGTENHTKRLNYHVLFDPDVSPDIIQEQLLNCLSKGYLITDDVEWLQTPTKRSLEELGKKIKKEVGSDNSIHDKSDLEVGFINITYKKEDILQLLSKDCFKGRYLTAIGYAEWNQFRWDQSAAEKRTLINQANFCLTSQTDVQQIKSNEESLRSNNLKSIILQSSDCHNFDDLCKSHLWLKTDPTFAGLKQVLNEPDCRIFIGDSPPNFKHSHQIISKVSIANSHNWFKTDFELELNKDLVTVIGGRGSGKTALVEMIAYGAGSRDTSNISFIKKAKEHKESLENVTVCITWEDGTVTCHKIGELAEDKHLVRYLPQQAFEALCDPNNNSLLKKQIENVIFQSLDETDKLGTSDFTELQSILLQASEEEKQRVIQKINSLTTEINNSRKIIESLDEKKSKLDKDKGQLDQLRQTLPELQPEDLKVQEELSKLYELKKLFDNEIVSLKSQLNTLESIRSKVKYFLEQSNNFQSEIIELAKIVGLEDAELFSVTIKVKEIEEKLNSVEGSINQKISILREGSALDNSQLLRVEIDVLIAANLDSVLLEIETKSKETKAYETEKLKYQQQRQLILQTEKQIEVSQAEVRKIVEEVIPKVLVLENERSNQYASFFEILLKQKDQIESLYQPLQQSLMSGTDTDRRLKFEAKISYDIDQHLDRGIAILDRTRRGNYRDIEALKNALKELWLQYFRSDFDSSSIKDGIKKLAESFIENDDEEFKIEEQLRSMYSIQDFDNWLYNLSHFAVSSSMQFDGTDLRLLSPGQKGIVLLMLYLEIDKADQRPLLIDQPEDNLDSLSVYNDLIRFFRERKQYRQIIMVTHNPNLVVNTDAEQVIVANYSGIRIPRLEYTSGSLEDQVKGDPSLGSEELENGIIENVCSILEGGDIAFDQRKVKYEISPKNFKYKNRRLPSELN